MLINHISKMFYYYLLVVAFFVVIGLFLLRIFIEGGQFKKKSRCDGKVILITGANTGIGKETALELAKRGGKVYLACRSLTRANEACRELKQLSGSNEIFVRELDLSSMESIRNFAKSFKEKENRIDILINNAGVMACPHMTTKDGFEMQIGVNHLGHFLLTNLLLDMVKSSTRGRIVNLSSLAHEYGTINKEDLMSEKKYNQITAYCQSKLANILFTRELAKRLKDTNVTVNAVHPGTVKTELNRHMGSYFFLFEPRLVNPLLGYFFKSSKSGAQTSLYAALDEDLECVSGKYFADCKQARIVKAGLDDETAKWLWEQSEKLTKISTKIE